MANRRFQFVALAGLMFAIVASVGCAKKMATVTPPPPPPLPAPTATLAATPNDIVQGQSTTLIWRTQNATQIAISGLGTVPASGSRTLTPGSSTTYNLTARGAGGTQEASARVTVTMPPAAAKQSSESEEDLFGSSMKDVYFDLDKAEIRQDDSPVTTADGQFLAQHPDIKVVIEGHCDDRGSEEYNLALGARRAASLKEALSRDGVSADRIKTISYGKEKPFCSQDDEQCWQQNRRDHFVFQR